MTSKLKFTGRTQFFATLKSKVDHYFAENKLSKQADVKMWFKVVFFLLGFTGTYLLILFGGFNVIILLLLAILLGMFSAFVGFNVCHDAIHGSLSRNKFVNKVFSFFFYLIGANPYIWSITHNIVHHTYTNIPGHDEDIEVAPGLIRISEDDVMNRVQRFQHLYAFPLYGLASISWVFRKDYKKFFQKKIGEHDVRHPRIEYFNLFFFKALYYSLFIVAPLVVLDIAWWQFIIGFLALHLAEGLTMGLVFQLAHVVEGTSFPFPGKNGNIEEAWAEHQMRTTANFSTHSPLAAFFLGGLNRQIEHHLFPKICHTHYGRLSAIVRQTAGEFGLPYIESTTFFNALLSHYRILRRYGKEANGLVRKSV